jgi:hypothetical protein
MIIYISLIDNKVLQKISPHKIFPVSSYYPCGETPSILFQYYLVAENIVVIGRDRGEIQSYKS